MGVKNWDFIPWRTVSIDEIEPKVIAIDTPNYMTRRMMSFEFKRKKSIERVPTSHISVTLALIRSALRKNFLPIFVFDGLPEDLKRAPNPELMQEAGELFRNYQIERDPYDSKLAERLVKSPSVRWYFSSNHIKEICSAVGIPIISAPSEAEMLAAVMCKEGIAGTVLSNDADALLFGSPHVTKTLLLSKGTIERCTLEDLQESVSLDLDKLRDLAIVSGCDFHDGLKGIGPRKGTVQLQRYGNLEGLLKARGISVSERAPFLEARDVFDEPDYISTNGISTNLRAPMVSSILKILKPVIGTESSERFVRELIPLWKGFGREQTTLEQWV